MSQNSEWWHEGKCMQSVSDPVLFFNHYSTGLCENVLPTGVSFGIDSFWNNLVIPMKISTD